MTQRRPMIDLGRILGGKRAAEPSPAVSSPIASSAAPGAVRPPLGERLRKYKCFDFEIYVDPEDVIAWFRREEAAYPIRFGAIAFDYVGGYFRGEVPDEAQFAGRFIKFCPDSQMDGPVSAKKMGKEFQRSREIFCWWD